MSLSGRAAAKIVDPVSALYRKFREGNVPNTSMSCWTRVVNNEYTHTVGVATILRLYTPHTYAGCEFEGISCFRESQI